MFKGINHCAKCLRMYLCIELWYKILSRANEVGSPTNPPWAPGSDKTQGQGSYKKIKKETKHTFDPLFTKTW